MTRRRTYRATRHGRVFVVRSVAAGANQKIQHLRLLVDTGSSYTVLPVETLTSLGCDLDKPLQTVRIMTASGFVRAPVVEVRWFHCLGWRMDQFRVVAHTLPKGSFVDGLLGMDFLERAGAAIFVSRSEIRVARPS